jgi:hypothetical protein
MLLLTTGVRLLPDPKERRTAFMVQTWRDARGRVRRSHHYVDLPAGSDVRADLDRMAESARGGKLGVWGGSWI